MLFVCARNEEVGIFNWFAGTNNYFRARGQQNYEGMTIEHVLCLSGKTSLIHEYRPKFDTKDFKGNLPLFYAI